MQFCSCIIFYSKCFFKPHLQAVPLAWHWEHLQFEYLFHRMFRNVELGRQQILFNKSSVLEYNYRLLLCYAAALVYFIGNRQHCTQSKSFAVRWTVTLNNVFFLFCYFYCRESTIIQAGSFFICSFPELGVDYQCCVSSWQIVPERRLP